MLQSLKPIKFINIRMTIVFLLSILIIEGNVYARQNQPVENRSGSFILEQPKQYSEEAIFSPDSLITLNEIIAKSEPFIQDSIIFNLGVAFRKIGDYNLSAFYFYKGLELSESQGDASLKAKYLTNIGINHSRSGNFNKSRLFYREALNVYELLKDSLRISYVYNNISMQYYREDNYHQALAYYQAANAIKQKLGLTGLKLNPNNPGQIYHKLGDYQKALYYHQLALTQIKEASESNFYAESISLLYIGDVYVDMGDLNNALANYEKSLSLAKQIDAKKIIEKVLGGISITYAKLQDFKNAYSFNEEQKRYIDTLTIYSNQVSGLEAQYAIKVQEKELELIKANSENEINRRNFIIIVITVVFAFLLGIIYLIFYNYKKNLKSENLIQKKNELLKEQRVNQLLKEKELKSMKAFIEGQEKERIRVARDLHDGLGGTLAGLRLSFERVTEKNPDNLQLVQLTKGFDQVYQEVRTVASNLAPPKFQSTYFTDILHSYFIDLTSSNQIVVNADFQPEEKLNLLPEKIKIELYRIIQELLANVLKHAAASSIEIQLMKHDEFVNLIVEDNGKGFNTNKKYKGMGVTNVTSRVELLNGKIDIDSKENRGTMFNIDIPVVI